MCLLPSSYDILFVIPIPQKDSSETPRHITWWSDPGISNFGLLSYCLCLFESIEDITMIVWTILLSVRLRLSQTTQSYFMQYRRLCVVSLPICHVFWLLREYVYFILLHNQIGSLNHWHFFCYFTGIETTVCTSEATVYNAGTCKCIA